MTILKSSPEDGDGFTGSWGGDTSQATLQRRAWSVLMWIKGLAATAARVAGEQWRENVVKTSPRWFVVLLVGWAALAVVVLVAVTALAIIAF
jgi:hypothetical protein